MAIRTNANPRQMDLQPELRGILMRNGLEAHVTLDGEGYRLLVQGHDSPLLSYPITERQMLALTDWGTNTANKKAYNVLTGILSKDFYLPKDFVHARNANGRVAMGLHGYRIGIGEYGRLGRLGMPPPFLGWTPRHQWGFHLRRVGGRLFYPGPYTVPERWDGRMKPGEMQSGGYGFYYKGDRQPQAAPVQQDVLQQLEAVIEPMASIPRSREPARPYKELVASPVYFSNEKWQECLASHGLIVDAERRTLTVQSERVEADMIYDLTDEETAALTSNSVEEHPVERRLEVLNRIIGEDFADPVTMEALDSERRIDIGLHPEIAQELAERQRQEEELLRPMERQMPQEHILYGTDAAVDGRDLPLLDERKGWYREEMYGREVEVGQIGVHPAQAEGKYVMTAVIDGRVVSHEITQRDYDRFLAVDDYHRMRLFSKIFSEVEMKPRPETQRGLGAKIFAALTAGAVVTAGVAHGLSHHRHAPEIYGGHYGGPPRPYFKPGVDTPRDVAIRAFEAEMNREVDDMRRGR